MSVERALPPRQRSLSQRPDPDTPPRTMAGHVVSHVRGGTRTHTSGFTHRSFLFPWGDPAQSPGALSRTGGRPSNWPLGTFQRLTKCQRWWGNGGSELGRDRGPCSLLRHHLPEAHFSKGLSGSCLRPVPGPRKGLDANALTRPRPVKMNDGKEEGCGGCYGGAGQPTARAEEARGP